MESQEVETQMEIGTDGDVVAEGVSQEIPAGMLAVVLPRHNEGPPIYDYHPRRSRLPELSLGTDPVMRHIIELQRYEQQAETIHSNMVSKRVKDHPLPMVPRLEKNKSRGDANYESFMLTRDSVDDSLRQVCVLMARVFGFERADQMAIDTMADLLDEFLKKLCDSLREAQDREALLGSTAHCDTLNQAFYDVGITGGVRDILASHNNLLHRRIQLKHQCNRYHVGIGRVLELRTERSAARRKQRRAQRQVTAKGRA